MHCSFFAVTIARPFGAPLEIFACSAPLSSAVSRGRLSWTSFFFFFFLYFSLPCFFVRTRGYVRQRRVITLNNAARRVATGFCPNERRLRCNRKAENAVDASIDSISCPLGFPLRSRIGTKKKRKITATSESNRRSIASLISFRYSVVKVLQIYKRVRRNVTACLSLSTWHHTHAHTLSFSPSLFFTLFFIIIPLNR